MTNLLNTDQFLIQIKLQEKVQHIENAQWSTKGRSVTLTEGPLYISRVNKCSRKTKINIMTFILFLLYMLSKKVISVEYL